MTKSTERANTNSHNSKSDIDKSAHSQVILAQHKEAPKKRKHHKQLHPHHRLAELLTAGAMLVLGLLLLATFKPVAPTVIKPPSESIDEDVSKIMPALEPDFDSFTNSGVVPSELDESLMGRQ